MRGIDDIIIKLMQELEPLDSPDELDPELVDMLIEQAGRKWAIWECSSCSEELAGTSEDFRREKWQMAVIWSDGHGWTGYIRIISCPTCRTNKKVEEFRHQLVELLDDWGAEAQ